MIGPGGLVLVVSSLYAVPVLVLWVGLEKSKYLILDARNIFAESHTEHCWRCSYTHNLYVVQNQWNKLDKLFFLSTNNGRECNARISFYGVYS